MRPFFSSNSIKCDFDNYHRRIVSKYCCLHSKDLGITHRQQITRVVVVLFHLSHFLLKKEISVKKISPSLGIEPGSFGTPAN